MTTTATIIREANGCQLWETETEYIMWKGLSGTHTLDKANTDAERLDAHWAGYLALNPGEMFRVSWQTETGMHSTDLVAQSGADAVDMVEAGHKASGTVAYRYGYQ